MSLTKISYSMVVGAPANVLDYGAKGDGVTDDTAAIQLAINSGKRVFFPAGTYILTIGTSITLEGGSTFCALVAISGMQLTGDGWNKSILKLKDNQSTNANPKYFNIIAGNTVMNDILIDGLQFDINGANNQINANNGFNCAAFICSGSVATVGVDARVIDMKFTNNLVQNNPGNNCLGLGQSNSVGSVLGFNVEISGNIFYNNGLDTNDHSTIYAWAENVDIHDNTFYHPTMSSGQNGPRVACELHGARNNFHDNDVYNYFGGVYIAGNLTNLSYHQSITNNNFVVCNFGVTAFIESATEPGCAYVSVSGNRVWITNDNASAAKVGIGINPSNGNVDNVSVTGNIIYSSDTNICKGITVYALATATIANILVSGNNIQGVTLGVQVGFAATSVTSDNVSVIDNLIRATTTVGQPTYAFGVYLPGPVGSVTIQGNNFLGAINTCIYSDSGLTGTTLRLEGNSGNGLFTNGINLTTNSAVTNLTMANNDFLQATSAQIIDQFTCSGRRFGRQARTFAGVPAQSAWYIGDVCYVATVANSAGVVTGYYRLTNGSGHVVNTDWRGFGVTV
jgi:hypothetical protein